MTGAVLGLAGTVLAAVLLLFGVLRTSHAPSHLAEAQAWALLVDEVQEERDAERRRAEECEERERRRHAP